MEKTISAFLAYFESLKLKRVNASVIKTTRFETMDLYKLMVVHWSIFTLSIQLIYCASVYSNVDSSPVMTESICNPDTQTHMREKQIGSSLILNLHPENTHTPCKSLLTAPESHGFFVRLHKPVGRKTAHSGNGSSSSNNSNGGNNNNNNNNNNDPMSNKNLDRLFRKHNTTSSCPLSIISTNDPLTPPWKIDPCLLETQGLHEEPVRLLPGQLKITWNHGGNMPMYKLIVTSLGKGFQCNQKGKHPCLRFGHETMLCVSDKLVCDGIRHCPAGNEYDSDEDAELCTRLKFGTEAKPANSIRQQMSDPKKVIPLDIIHVISSTNPPLTQNPSLEIQNGTENAINPTIRKKMKTEHRTSLTRGLSRYGPWGYLMLGMLLCGGALLICGLWECCCRNRKPCDTNDLNRNISTISTENNTTFNSTSDPITPPNYDDIDPPPSYATLFPNQKTTTNLTIITDDLPRDNRVNTTDATTTNGVN